MAGVQCLQAYLHGVGLMGTLQQVIKHNIDVNTQPPLLVFELITAGTKSLTNHLPQCQVLRNLIDLILIKLNLILLGYT